MKLIIVIVMILCLLYMIAKKKWNAFLSMLFIAILTGICLGLPLPKIMDVFEEGMGNLLGSLALILGLGAMIAQLMEESGAATALSKQLIKLFGAKWAQWSILLIGVLIGFALFFDAAFILLIPIVLNVAKQLTVPPLYLGLPAAAALLTIHTFFPPHPGAVEIVRALKVNQGLLLVVGLFVAIPSMIVSGILYSRYILRKENIVKNKELSLTIEATPSFIKQSFLVMILPVLLIAIGSFVPMLCSIKMVNQIMQFIGHPVIALFITLIIVIYLFGYRQQKTTNELMDSLAFSVTTIALVLLINGAGGGLKQVLIAGGVTDEIQNIMSHLHLSPLLTGFILTALMRVTLGSSTIAAMTASSMVIGMNGVSGIDGVLVALAIGAGSMCASHVNDPGFWLFKQYFNLSVKETFKTWTMMTIIGSLTSLLILNVLYILL